MKNIILSTCIILLSISSIQSQENNIKEQKSNKAHIEIKSDLKPDIYVDGKKFDFPIELLDKDKIASVNVVKGEKAITEYNAQNGVVLVITKLANSNLPYNDTGKMNSEIDKIPMVIIDGEESDHEALNKYSPEDIESVNVVKGEEAIKKYKATNGVIIVKTKKGSKQ